MLVTYGAVGVKSHNRAKPHNRDKPSPPVDLTPAKPGRVPPAVQHSHQPDPSWIDTVKTPSNSTLFAVLGCLCLAYLIERFRITRANDWQTFMFQSKDRRRFEEYKSFQQRADKSERKKRESGDRLQSSGQGDPTEQAGTNTEGEGRG